MASLEPIYGARRWYRLVYLDLSVKQLQALPIIKKRGSSDECLMLV